MHNRLVPPRFVCRCWTVYSGQAWWVEKLHGLARKKLYNFIILIIFQISLTITVIYLFGLQFQINKRL